MPRNVVLLGDKNSLGGEVISASSTLIINGQRVALVGDEVWCPLHGINPVVEGCEDWFEEGRAVVVDGCASACGCTVIASVNDFQVL